MTKEATRTKEYIENQSALYLAFELGASSWHLGFTVGLGQKPRVRTIAARDLEAAHREIAMAKERFGLPGTAPVRSCYEAGRDGFWLHRALSAAGIDDIIVDSASIEVNRRARRAKADKLDVKKLVTMLVRYWLGESKIWSVVRVPSPEEEDKRQLHRELSALKNEQTRITNRIKGLLMSQGIRVVTRGLITAVMVKAARLWDGSALPIGLKSRLLAECDRLIFVRQQIRRFEVQRRELLQQGNDETVAKIKMLRQLRAVGPISSWVLVQEFFGWRKFKNGREVGSLAGLTPTPYGSGDMCREQGISKAGNRHVRAIAVELAWTWRRLQPDSQLSRWYEQRFANGGTRARKVGIVALARRLLIALWRFLETGALPDGAQLKAT